MYEQEVNSPLVRLQLAGKTIEQGVYMGISNLRDLREDLLGRASDLLGYKNRDIKIVQDPLDIAREGKFYYPILETAASSIFNLSEEPTDEMPELNSYFATVASSFMSLGNTRAELVEGDMRFKNSTFNVEAFRRNIGKLASIYQRHNSLPTHPNKVEFMLGWDKFQLGKMGLIHRLPNGRLDTYALFHWNKVIPELLESEAASRLVGEKPNGLKEDKEFWQSQFQVDP